MKAGNNVSSEAEPQWLKNTLKSLIYQFFKISPNWPFWRIFVRFSNKNKSQILCDIYSNFQTLCESKPKKNEKKKNEEEEMTGIKGMQIGKNESCSLLFVLKAASIGDRGSGEKRLLMPFGKKSAHFKGFTRPSTTTSANITTITVGGWVCATPPSKQLSWFLPKILFCVSSHSHFSGSFLCPSKLILINTRLEALKITWKVSYYHRHEKKPWEGKVGAF